MPTNRDNFKKSTKQRLAERVAWRCSFPGCPAVTIGPGYESNEQVIKQGEAAHIYAASPEGPRYNSQMSSEERASIDNGIWMCCYHAELIDSDYTRYSADTLKQWKAQAEYKTYEALRIPNQVEKIAPETLVQLGSAMVFYATWIGVSGNEWDFEIHSFVYGDERNLKEYCSNFVSLKNDERYLVIESQGDGRRILSASFKVIDKVTSLKASVEEKNPRRDPYSLGMDLKFVDYNGQFGLSTANGGLAVVQGIELAKQHLSITLSSNSLGFGVDSFFCKYCCDYKAEDEILKRLLKLEIIRLSSICHGNDKAPLDCINRVLDVSFPTTRTGDKICVDITIEWGNQEITKDKYWLLVGN